MFVSETKRKRLDMNPVSKSQASSNLIKNIERNKGRYLKDLWYCRRHEFTINILGPPRKKLKRNTTQGTNKRKGSPLPTESSREIFAKRRRMNRKISAQFSIESMRLILISKIDIVFDSDSESEEETTTPPRCSNLDTSIEISTLQVNHDSPSEETPDPHNIGINESDIIDAQSTLQIPSSSSSHDSVAFQMPNTTERKINISFLCHPGDEELTLRQPRVSELFGDHISSVQKRSWAKDSTCEWAHLR